MALFAMTLCIPMDAETVTINNIKYNLYGTEASVTGYTGEPVNVEIPQTINVDGQTFKVTQISRFAFSDNKSLTSIKADYIRNIRENAFYGSKLKKASFKNVGSIFKDAFENCSLEQIDLGTNPIDFSSGCFRGCGSLRYIVIPTGSSLPYSYDQFVFNNCSRLQTIIYLGRNLGSQGSNANVYTASDLVTWSNNNFTYTGNAPKPSFTNLAPANFQVTNYVITGIKKDVGSYTDSIAFTFTNSDMSFNTKIPYRYTIAKARLTARVQDASKAYGDANPQFTVRYSGFVNYENQSVLDNPGVVTTSVNSSSAVGTYPLTLSGATDNNYDINVVNGTLTVSKAQLTVKASNKERTYGAENPQPTLEYTGLRNNEGQPEWTTMPTISINASPTSPVGTYEINVSGGVAPNYNITFSKGTLTVSKAPLRVTADNRSRFYYEPNPTLTCSYSGFVNGENETVLTKKPHLSTTATLKSKADNYPINIDGAQAQNYTFTYETGTLEVMKRSLIVSTNNYKRAYNEDNPAFELTYNGFVTGENENVLIVKPAIKTSATKTSDVGTYTLVVSGGMADNYEFVYNNGQLIIEKAYQTLTWDQDLSYIAQFSQIELNAKTTSGLPITYTLSNDTVCSLNYIGEKTYLDCYHYGQVTISAIQNGNYNYWPTTKSYKVMSVSDATGIKSVATTKPSQDQVSVTNGRILVTGVADGTPMRIYTLSGSTVYAGPAQEVTVPSGIYIVRIGKSARKIVVK